MAIVTDQLTAAGVVVKDEWDAADKAVVRSTPWQVQNMAAEAANGGGIPGIELEGMYETPVGAPPVEFLISAWAMNYDSDAARLAHAVLGDRDFHEARDILFPSLVMTLFLADATRGDTAEPIAQSIGTGQTAATASFQLDAAASPCGIVQNFVQSAIATVVNALKVDVKKSSTFWTIIGSIWNAAVDLAAKFVKGLIDAVTRPITQALVTIFGVVETIRQLSTYLYVWRTKLTPDPASNKFGTDGKNEKGRITLSVEDNRVPIPAEVIACAAAFDVDLTAAGSAAGSAVTWVGTNTPRPDLAAYYRAEPVLSEEQTAFWDYDTGQESEEAAAKGEPHVGVLHVNSTLRRNDIEKIRALFVHLVFNQLPSIIRGIVEAVVKPILDAATSKLTSLTNVKSSVDVPITFHGDPPPETAKPSTAPSTKPGGCPADLLSNYEAHDTASTVNTVSYALITPDEFLSDTAPYYPGLTGGKLPTCALSRTESGANGTQILEAAYFVGSGPELVPTVISALNAAGFTGDTTATGGFLFYDNTIPAIVAYASAAQDATIPAGYSRFGDQSVSISVFLIHPEG
ncbi:MAG: hypothetical protein ABI632_00510 [Pseudolysinimonas sp.]